MIHCQSGDKTPHVAVCICTYKRAAFLQRLLKELAGQETEGLFTHSIVVVDNDSLQSAKPVVEQFIAFASIPTIYCVEPQQNIALARNKAIAHASGDFVAFIDDDEFPDKRWLLTLLEACHTYSADGVLGPVKPYFDETPPKWVVKGGFYMRPTYPTGFVIDWTKGRTGNTLFKRSIIQGGEQPFRPEFRTGEDQDFFRRMIINGHRFIWCNEAVAYEVVPPVRWNRSFMLRRALLRGQVSVLYPTCDFLDIMKSLIAVPMYSAILPIALMCGQHRFMALLVKLCDHIGKLLALIGIKVVTEPYVTSEQQPQS